MTFTELTVAVALTVLFLCGLASASLPLAEADARSERLLREARETDFVIRGFRNACAREGGDFTGWTQAIALVFWSRSICAEGQQHRVVIAEQDVRNNFV